MRHLIGRLFLSSCALLLTLGAVAAEKLNFTSSVMTAGKASLTEHGYIVPHLLGIANFSPELAYPLQLIFRSTSENSGIFGFVWNSPQLESNTVPELDGVLWQTPWGEKIKFFSREKSDKKILRAYGQEGKKGGEFFAPYANWQLKNLNKGSFEQSGDWQICGTDDHKGWTFTYKNAKLEDIIAPSGRSIKFTYDIDGRLKTISQFNRDFVVLEYFKNGLVKAISCNGVRQEFEYSGRNVTMLPKTLDGSETTVNLPFLTSISLSGINPVQFDYDAQGYLTTIKRGDFIEQLTVVNETLAERRQNLTFVEEKKLPEAKRKIKHSTKVSGMLLADGNFKYVYPLKTMNAGLIELVNNAGQSAYCAIDSKTNNFTVTEFSGKNYTMSYFNRLDVAYMGKVKSIVDNRGRTMASYRYDKDNGKVLSHTDFLGNETIYTYDKAGNTLQVARKLSSDAKAETLAKMSYDTNGNMLTISPLNQNGKALFTNSLTYDCFNQVVAADDGRNKNSYIYNEFGYIKSITDVFGCTVMMECDQFNRLISMTDRYGIVTTYHYLDNGLIDRIERKDGEKMLNFMKIDFDAAGRAISYTDHHGRIKQLEHDAYGRTVKEYFPDSTSIAYEFDSLGNLVKVTDQNSNVMTFKYGYYGIENKMTGANQLTDYIYDKYGLLTKLDSKQNDKIDRSVHYSYDAFDRISTVNYDSGEAESFKYDALGRRIEIRRGKKKALYNYDFNGRLVQKQEGETSTNYTYNEYGQRLSRVTRGRGIANSEYNSYDQYGRLVQTKSGNKTIAYTYNDKNQLILQDTGSFLIHHNYDRYGRLSAKIMGDLHAPISKLEYSYDADGTILGRTVNGQFQHYAYDARGQLLSVTADDGSVIEHYTYDAAGNILGKIVGGRSATYTYDSANQLVSSTENGKTTFYAYDAAGRLVKEGNTEYTYGYMDKIMLTARSGQMTAKFDYHVDGQLATVNRTNGKRESFLWDELKLIQRDMTSYVNEPHHNGGSPLFAGDRILFNDILGTSLGVAYENDYAVIERTAFGDTLDTNPAAKYDFFTGKPFIGELGYTFLFRNYRPDQGKWQTSDPLGFPDGWNNLAYVNNGVTNAFDWLGCAKWELEAVGAQPSYSSGIQSINSNTAWSLDARLISSLNSSRTEAAIYTRISLTIYDLEDDVWVARNSYGLATSNITYEVDDKGYVSYYHTGGQTRDSYIDTGFFTYALALGATGYGGKEGGGYSASFGAARNFFITPSVGIGITNPGGVGASISIDFFAYTARIQDSFAFTIKAVEK